MLAGKRIVQTKKNHIVQAIEASIEQHRGNIVQAIEAT
jgi:hypothetical protein